MEGVGCGDDKAWSGNNVVLRLSRELFVPHEQQALQSIISRPVMTDKYAWRPPSHLGASLQAAVTRVEGQVSRSVGSELKDGEICQPSPLTNPVTETVRRCHVLHNMRSRQRTRQDHRDVRTSSLPDGVPCGENHL